MWLKGNLKLHYVAYTVFPLDSAALCYIYINKIDENSKIISLLKCGYIGCKNSTEYLLYNAISLLYFNKESPSLNTGAPAKRENLNSKFKFKIKCMMTTAHKILLVTKI